MSDVPSSGPERTRTYSQLLRQQERALQLLHRIADELQAPVTDSLLDQLQSPPAAGVRKRVEEVLARIQDAIQTAEECESAIHRALVKPDGDEPLPGPPNLPAALVRFLAERKDSPGFSFDIVQDPIRGWVIRWKDYGQDGSVCGGGQFYENPYAWLES